ncbi:hypothetical protein DFH06DRAFT_566447 [Mycena polygramma]|nr:hypothetical protein DFH06DRAFT_566447 [Mycena polygramma]
MIKPFLLPDELVDEVLDHLGGDSTSSDLQRYSLVGRAWVSRSRYYLFESCTLLPKNILVFRDLLRSPQCTFLRYIRAIKATRYHWHHHDGCFNDIADDLRLTRVHTLEMTLNIVVDATNEDAFFRAGFVAAFPHVTRLVLTCNFKGRPAPLIDMICVFPSLQELHVRPEKADMSHEPADNSGRHVHRVVEPAEPAACAMPPLGLRSLHLSAYTTGSILAWLRTANRLPQVRSLTLPAPERRHARVVHAALQQLGGLRHLDITLTHDTRTVFALSLHPNLKTLTVRETFSCPLILGLAAPRLELLSLECQDSHYVDVEQLDAFLGPTQFPRLGSVVLKAHKLDRQRVLLKNLPRLAASGVLRVDLPVGYTERSEEPDRWLSQHHLYDEQYAGTQFHPSQQYLSHIFSRPRRRR